MDDSQTVTVDDLALLVKRGVVESGQYLPATSFLRDAEFWKTWALRALLALAVGHILSGIIFFFAFNWNDLSGMTKFAVVGGGIMASVIAWVIAKLDSPAGQAFGIAATVLVGVMFAVMGQVYQTPAMIHTPFVFWAILTLPFALASRNLAHWAVWLTILVVAITSYANSGLRLVGNDAGANLMNICVATGFVAALIGFDKLLSPRLKWARGEWFRVLLVFGAIGFALFGFTESFWDRDTGALWFAAIAIVCGLIAYLYFLKPSLATLALASFGLFTLLAQLGFKILDFNAEVGQLFGIFIWLGMLTVGLVFAFRHFAQRLKTKPIAPSQAEDETREPYTVSTESFASHIEADAPRMSEILSSDDDRDPPWYISLFLALAGILTAIIGGLFFGSIVSMFVRRADEIVFGILGLLIFAVSIFLRRKTKFQYVQHILNTLIMAGGALAAAGFGDKIRDLDGIIALLLILSLIVLCLVRDRILEFLSAAAIITLVGIELYHLKFPMVETFILTIATVLGVVLLTRPIRNRLYNAAGTAFLIAPALVGIALVHVQRWDNLAETSRFADDWPSRIISLIVLLGAVAYLNRGKALADFNPPLPILTLLVIGAALVPLGGASALLLILAGYILGSRTLAIIGTLLQIYFLTMFYYDLSLDLFTKSIILFISGLIFLGVWILARKSEGATS